MPPKRKSTSVVTPAVATPRPLSLTNSSITDFLSCARRYQYKYEQQLSKKSIPTPLIIGDIVHHGLAELMLGKSLEEALAVVKVQIDLARKKQLEDPDDFESDATIIEGMIRGWHVRRGHLKGASVWDWGGKKWVEQVFVWIMPDGTRITGKIDGVVVRPDGVWLVEHKTASQINTDYINRLTVDAQVSMYYWAVAKIYGQRPKGIIYNVIRKPGIRQTKKETPADFQNRLLKVLTTEDGYYFSTQLFRDETQVAAFDATLGYIVEDVKRERQRGAWVMNPSQCAPIGRTCPMLPLCSNPASVEVRALYEVRKDLHPELVG